MIAPRLLWLAACSVLFAGVYGGCTAVTALRHDVGTWHYAWEFEIPFVPAAIVPYWSIDLLFVGAFFVCGSRIELGTMGRRIVLAILLAGSCFLLFPLKLGFPRPAVDGPLGALFEVLRGFDQPTNLCPSLHIALRTILAVVYARHTRGLLNVGVHAWFFLVGLSTLLTYQHHVVDVAGGFVLAAVCFYLFREAEESAPTPRAPGIAAFYALGCAAAIAVAAFAWPWGAVMVYAAVSLGGVSLGYAGIGPRIYRKGEGRLPLSARLLLGPVLLGHWLSFLHYRRQCRPWDAVTPNVWIGRALNDREARQAIEAGVSAVVDLTSEFSEAAPLRALTYRNIPVLDLTAPTPTQMREAVDFITDHARRGVVYVHCKAGYSRSAAVVGAYLVSSGRASGAEEAVARLRAVRPALVVRPEARAALDQFARVA